jgi:hypothetical protein
MSDPLRILPEDIRTRASRLGTLSEQARQMSETGRAVCATKRTGGCHHDSLLFYFSASPLLAYLKSIGT